VFDHEPVELMTMHLSVSDEVWMRYFRADKAERDEAERLAQPGR
jgi:hypothetical protein